MALLHAEMMTFCKSNVTKNREQLMALQETIVEEKKVLLKREIKKYLAMELLIQAFALGVLSEPLDELQEIKDEIEVIFVKLMGQTFDSLLESFRVNKRQRTSSMNSISSAQGTTESNEEKALAVLTDLLVG